MSHFTMRYPVVKQAKARKKTVFPLDDDDDSTQVSEILRWVSPIQNRCRRSTLKYQIREQSCLLFFECLLPFLCNKQKIHVFLVVIILEKNSKLCGKENCTTLWYLNFELGGSGFSFQVELRGSGFSF